MRCVQSVLSCLIRLVWHSPYLLNLVFFPGRARSALLPYQDYFILFLGKPLFGSQKVIFPSFGSQNKIFTSFYQSYYNFSFIRLTKVNFSTILSIFCQFFHHSIKVFLSLFRRNFYRWKNKIGWYFLRKNGVIFLHFSKNLYF